LTSNVAPKYAFLEVRNCRTCFRDPQKKPQESHFVTASTTARTRAFLVGVPTDFNFEDYAPQETKIKEQIFKDETQNRAVSGLFIARDKKLEFAVFAVNHEACMRR